MLSILSQIVRRSNVPVVLDCPADETAGYRVLPDSTAAEIDALRDLGFRIVRVVPRPLGRFTALLVEDFATNAADREDGWNGDVTSYELDALIGDGRKRLISVAAHGNGRFAVAWVGERS